MGDETTQETTESQTTETQTETQPVFSSFIAEDGTLKEGWRNFVPEDIRADKIFDRMKSVEGVFKTLSSQERMKGKNTIPLPDNNSTEDDWNAFYKAVGMLDTPEGYKVEKDADIPDEYWPDEIVNTLQKAHHEARVNEKQAAIYNKAWNEFLKQQINKLQVDSKLEADQELEKLKTEWSGSYDSNIHIGNLAFEKSTEGDPELKERVKNKFGSDPDFARLMKNLGVHFKEGGTLDVDTTVTITRDQIDEQMNELRNSDAYKNRMNPGHKAALEKMSRLYAERAKIK